MVVNVLEVLGHGLGGSLVSFLGLDEVRGDLGEFIHKGVVVSKVTGVLEEACEHGDLIGVNRLAQHVVLGKAEELIIGVLSRGGVVVGNVHHGTGTVLLAVLRRLDNLGRGAGTSGEYANGILVETLVAHSKELGSDYAVGLDLGRGGIEPVLHGKGVGPGTTAADEEDVGITLLADLIHGLVDLGTKGERIADNLLITRNIKVEHGISSFISAALPLNPPPLLLSLFWWALRCLYIT